MTKEAQPSQEPNTTKLGNAEELKSIKSASGEAMVSEGPVTEETRASEQRKTSITKLDASEELKAMQSQITEMANLIKQLAKENAELRLQNDHIATANMDFFPEVEEYLPAVPDIDKDMISKIEDLVPAQRDLNRARSAPVGTAMMTVSFSKQEKRYF